MELIEILVVKDLGDAQSPEGNSLEHADDQIRGLSSQVSSHEYHSRLFCRVQCNTEGPQFGNSWFPVRKPADFVDPIELVDIGGTLENFLAHVEF